MFPAVQFHYVEPKRSSNLLSAAFLCSALFFSNICFAQTSAFTYEGRLFSSSGLPLLESIGVKFQILNPAGNCVLYEEVQSGIDLSQTKGAFSLGVGSHISDAKRSANFRGAYNPSMISVFRNGAALSGIPAADCVAGAYVAGASDSRLLRVHVTKGGTTETLSPDLVINTVPSAQVAASLQGFLPSDFLRLDVANGISGNIGLTATGTAAGQTREFRFYELAASGSDYTAFKAPDAMTTSLTYVLPSGAPAAGDVLKATVPSAGIVTLSWGADAGAGGGISNFNGSSQSSQSFTAVDIAAAVTAPAWSTNAGTGAHTLQIPMAAGAGVTGGLITKTEHTAFSAKVDRAGDTMTGLLNFTGATGISLANTSGITFTGTGTLAMGTNKITGMADPSNAQEAATKAYVDSQSSGKISGTLTATRIPYASGASTLSDDAAFVWDNTNKRLGIGVASPTGTLHVVGGTASAATNGSNITITAQTGGAGNQNGGDVIISPGSGSGGGNRGIVQISNYGSLQLDGGSALTWGGSTAYIQGGGGGSPNYIALLSGNVGIGTTTPLHKLHVHEASGGTARLQFSNTDTGQLTTDGFYVGVGSSEEVLFSNKENTHMQFSTNNLERLRIDASGNVGIGTTNPQAGFHLLASDAEMLMEATATNSYSNFSIKLPAASTGAATLQFQEAAVDKGSLGYNAGTNSLQLSTWVAEPIAFITNSSERRRIDASGNVGIGTTSPGALLDIGLAGTTLGTMRLEGNTSGYVQLQPAAAAGSWTMTLPPSGGTNGYVLSTNGSGVTSWVAQSGGASSGASGYIQFSNGSSGFSSDTSQLFWDATNNRLGIGTATPAVTLEINSATGQNHLDIQRSGSSVFSVSEWGNIYIAGQMLVDPVSGANSASTPGYSFSARNGDGMFSAAANAIGFSTNGSERIRINSSGNVGIADTGPDAKLEVVGDFMVSATAAGDGNRFIVNSSGDVGIGTSSPTYKLEVSGGVYSQSLVTAGAGHVQTPRVDTYGLMALSTSGITFTSNAGVERMRILESGNVGIGTTSPRSHLDVAGTMTGKPSTANGSATIDFSAGNIQHTTADCGAYILWNLKDGGTYMFMVQGTALATCSFTAFSDAGTTPLTVHLPPGHGPVTATKHTLYNLAVSGTHVYLAWTPGY